jgi:hypothetical protein
MRQRRRRSLTGQGDDLADLLGRELTRGTATRAVGQYLPDGRHQTRARQRGEPLLGLNPTPSPLPDRVFIESQRLSNRFATLTVGSAQHNLRPLHQTVGRFAASRQTFQDGAWFSGQVNQRGGTGHGKRLTIRLWERDE